MGTKNKYAETNKYLNDAGESSLLRGGAPANCQIIIEYILDGSRGYTGCTGHASGRSYLLLLLHAAGDRIS